ncbi:hypothetical protein OS493_022547 [Desmophyllum pertusum]|uniref:Uncharacterized protein n=1 Tax=Desmophyllum pertusum TaxID=174260 RepID=A0A9W9ZBR7_9CNID|nr:hypothetical protein OS493_022547 [Desmophyllum pertusum]
MANREDDNTRHKGRELWEALKCDPVDNRRILELLDNDAPANFREPKTDRTPLHFVVTDRNGDKELMEMLLKHGAQANLGDYFDYTPLHLAAEKGDLRAVRRLLNNQAERNKLSRANKTPAQMAERNEHHEVVRYLLNETSDEDVMSDGAPNSAVNVSTSSGSSLTVNSPGGTVNVIVGDNGTFNYPDRN